MFRGTARSRLWLCSWVLLLSGASVFAEDLILRTQKPYTAIKQKIAALGGTVKYEFKNANALVVSIPDAKAKALKALPGIDSVVKDGLVPPPRPRDVRELSESRTSLPASAIPNNYFPYTSELTNARPLQLAGFAGQGVVVGIIDSGVSTAAAAVASRIVGGESFVPGAGEPGPTSPLNGDHGTFVACMIGANAAFGFAHDSSLATAIRTYCTPVSSAPCTFDAGGGIDGVPMVGQAPLAQFFALKVFPANGNSAPESRVLQAMDRAIELKKTTQPNMKVVNMSLGGTTFFAGKDVEDELATSMASAGITLVTSSGNAGPSGSTVGSPGTARNILTVGAASDPVHEWIFNDTFFGPGAGPEFRPDSRQQMAYFSSRGPNADGRPDPEVVANGVSSFVQGANGTSIFFADGTSFAAPTVAGVAALLYSAKPSATPSKIRAAIVRSARPDLIPAARREDQGAGYVNAAGAKALLDHGVLPAIDFGPGTKSVALNVLVGAGVIPVIGSHITRHVANLIPSERREFYFLVDRDTSKVHVTLSNITPSLPPDQQNQLFGDDVLFAVHSAKTSAIGQGDYLAFGFFNSDQAFAFDVPETGLMRVTVNGDWTNAGNVSADLTIEEEKAPLSKRDFKGSIAEGEEKVFTTQIAPGTASVTFALSWENNWGAYPTDDLDLFVMAPDGTIYFDGATISSPERATVANPAAGTWTIFVDGFTVFEKSEKFAVRVD